MCINVSLKDKVKFPKSGKNYISYLCDYIEFSIFTKKYESLSSDDLLYEMLDDEIRYLREKMDKYETKMLHIQSLRSKKRHIITDEDVEVEDEEDFEIDVEEDDQEQKYLKIIFNRLDDRSGSIKYYPFCIEDGNIKLKSNLTIKEKLYLMLLLLSYHNLTDCSPTLTTEFEKISSIALSKFLPTYAQIMELGKTSNGYTRALDKINDVSEKIQIPLDDRRYDQINYDNTQEEGTDIIAWLPFEDFNENKIVMLFQCTCQKNWFAKQGETERYDKLFEFSFNPIHGLMIPDLLNEGALFERDIDVKKSTLLFDRHRILSLIARKRNSIKKLKSYQLVNTVLEFE